LKKLIFTAAIAFAGAVLFSAERTLTLEDAVASALENNASIRRSALSLQAAERKEANSWNEFLPTASVGASWTENAANSAEVVGLTASASLTLSPALFADIEQTKLDLEAGRISREKAFRDVELAVRKTFYSLLYQREYLELLSGSIETARARYEQTLEKRNAGLVPEVDALSARVELESLVPDYEAAKTSYANSLDSFKQAIGIDPADEIGLEGGLDEALGIGDIDADCLDAQSASVALLENSVKAAESALKGAVMTNRLPSVSLSALMNPSRVLSSGAEWTESASLTASVSLSLDSFLPFSSRAEQIRTAADAQADLEIQLEDERLSAELELSSLLRSIAQSKSSLSARASAVELAKRNYQLTEEAYRKGAKDLLSLQSSADSLKEAEASLKQQSYALLAAVLELEYASGVPFGTLGRK